MYMSSQPLYMLFVQLGRVSSSAQSRGVEVKFQGFTIASPVSNNVQQADVVFGAGALGSDLKACVILWHGCGSHRCFSQEPSLIVLISAPHFLKKTSPRSLSLFSFCWVLVVFWPRRDPSTNYRKYTVFPQRGLRGSTISDNSSVSVKVIYYLCRTGFAVSFFRMNSTLVAGKCNFIAWRSCWVCGAASGYELCPDKNLFLGCVKAGYLPRSDLSCGLLSDCSLLRTAIWWNGDSSRKQPGWMELFAPVVSSVEPPKVPGEHTPRTFEQGRKTDLSLCRKVTRANKDTEVTCN